MTSTKKAPVSKFWQKDCFPLEYHGSDGEKNLEDDFQNKTLQRNPAQERYHGLTSREILVVHEGGYLRFQTEIRCFLRKSTVNLQ